MTKKTKKISSKLILRRKRLDGADSKIKSAFNVRYFTEEKLRCDRKVKESSFHLPPPPPPTTQNESPVFFRLALF
jgi:hypothetical protein